MTSEFTQTLGANTVGTFVPASFVQFFDGRSIIRIGRDCSLELGLDWTDHNEAATAFFNSLVDNVMPSWKEAVRAEQAAEVERLTLTVRKLQGHQAALESYLREIRDKPVARSSDAWKRHCLKLQAIAAEALGDVA